MCSMVLARIRTIKRRSFPEQETYRGPNHVGPVLTMTEQTSAGRTAYKMADWTELSYVVVDVEGNGHQPPDLVELAAVPIVSGLIGEPVSWLVRPDQALTPMAQRIHGISNKAV